MTRCQMRAMRQLKELHDAYNKHDYQVVGVAACGFEEETVYRCSCGTYGMAVVDNTIDPVGPVASSEWVYQAYHKLNTKQREEFKAYLKRIQWQSSTKKAARLIYGSRGRSMWQARYGDHESIADYARAKERADYGY
jgi:hypothetical protein